MLYQVFIFISSTLGPATIVLLLAGAVDRVSEKTATLNVSRGRCYIFCVLLISEVKD